ncbi:MAG: hypothetical protein R2764_10815 [Bacteroidales bacterium]
MVLPSSTEWTTTNATGGPTNAGANLAQVGLQTEDNGRPEKPVAYSLSTHR